jgi:hypothetical protein
MYSYTSVPSTDTSLCSSIIGASESISMDPELLIYSILFEYEMISIVLHT